MEIYAQNVNRAFHRAVKILCDSDMEGEMWARQTSRNGDTIEFMEPVATIYKQPTQRVLFNAARDANPFLHLFESLWMLAGRSDAAFMTTLVKRFGDYSDGLGKMQGAYGYRWRTRFGMDQIDFLVKHLRAKPDSRRAVLQMWDPRYDLQGVDYGTHVEAGINSKDIPCNTNAYFKIRDGRLNMTVCNRSNDLLWGAYGANAVHMSILQEYMAAKLGVGVGTYVQFSDSLHVYLGGPGGAVWDRVRGWFHNLPESWYLEAATYDQIKPMPMFVDESKSAHRDDQLHHWEEDLYAFFALWEAKQEMQTTSFVHPWWQGVAVPMWNAWKYRNLEHANAVRAEDWRKAALMWLAVHPLEVK